MHIRFWGTRGSIATPGPSTLRYGGNTSCVELRSSAGTLVILDCGTGARPLGQALVEEEDVSDAPVRGTVLLGHTHWDHIQGLPFFEPLFRPGRWDVYGPRGLGTSLNQTLAGQMNYQYFPVALDQLGADITYHELIEGTFEIDDLVIHTQYLNHPALTLGYRIECDGAVLCYIADHEPFDAALGAGGDVMASAEDAHHVAFLRGADVLVHDAQYDAEEYPSRVGWGHSTVPYVVDVACAAGVARTVLFHHDPRHDDARIDRYVVEANARAAGRTIVTGAAEGDIVEITALHPEHVADDVADGRWAATSPVVDELAPDVVIVGGDPELRRVVADAARAEDLGVVDGSDDTSGVPAGGHVVVVDVDDHHAVERFRSLLSESALTAPAVVAISRTIDATSDALAAVTHWLVWPASAAHVRTKLRAAVLGRACRWLTAPLPDDEEARLLAVHALGVLDTASDPRFEHVTDRVCREFRVPIGLITIVDRDRQWFLARHGIDVRETSRDESFCAHAILSDDVMQVPDTLDDARFADNPAVTGPPRVRFYAGAPIVLADGSRIGTLCIIDHRPRLLDADEVARLRAMADEVAETLESASVGVADGA